MLTYNKFIEMVKEKNKGDYAKLINELSFLRTERIKLVGNDLREMLGRTIQEVNKEKCVQSAVIINGIAEKHNIDFKMPVKWEDIDFDSLW